MDAPLRPIVRFLLWDYDRLSSVYVVLCALLAFLIVAIPPEWLGDPMALVP